MNIVQLLEEREQWDVRTKRVLENALEDSFIAGNAEQFDIAMPRSVSSTIAIAMSCNGVTFATTHGDHTVKVFDFGSGQQIRNFSGHPRTPWTLKYHPTDPNIIASGCLGFQVRIWDIKENACVNMIILNQTIISVAFHPGGEYIAVACGMRIDLWEWRVPLTYHEEIPQLPTHTPFAPNSKHLRHSSDESEDEDSPLTRSITHKRNIRAVIFHPSGDYIFAVAPDAPKQNNEELSHCKLYACEFQALFEVDTALRWDESFAEPAIRARAEVNKSPRGVKNGTSGCFESGQDKASTIPTGLNARFDASTAPGMYRGKYQVDRDDGEGGLIPEDNDMYVLPLKLSSCRVLIPQIHLYSDGGIDISRDGRYFITCSRVYVPAVPISGRDGSAGRSGNAPRSRNFPSLPTGADGSERRGDRPYPPPVEDEDTWLSRLSYMASGMRPGSAYPVVPPPPPKPTWISASAPPEAPPTLYIAQNFRNKGAGSDSNTGSNSPAVKKLSPAVSANTSPLQANTSATGLHNETGRNTSTAQKTRDNSYPDLPEMIAGLSLTDKNTIDGVPVVTDVTRGRIKLKAQGIALSQMPESAQTSSVVEHGGDGESDKMVPVWPRDQLRNASQDGVTHNPQHVHVRLEGARQGCNQEDHLCLFQFTFQPNGAIATPTLVNSKCLPGALTKAVTSAKLSSTCRYALIGYGVRAGGQVQDHPVKHAACEVVSVSEERMRSVTVMSDFEDEVNVAQFHPFPGHGIVYGTKRGKVRKFSKS